jgi:hypothetical protein
MSKTTLGYEMKLVGNNPRFSRFAGLKVDITVIGAMVISGIDREIPKFLIFVGTVSDHILTIDGKEISLRNLCGRNAKVVFEIATPFEILTKGLL